MQIYLLQNGQQIGPFSVEVILGMLSTRYIAPTDQGWHEGLAGWQSLNTFLPSPPPQPPMPVVSPMRTNQMNVNRLNVAGLTPYYQEEFQKIYDSGESYQGKWNWAAFWFGPLWAISKGASHSALAGFLAAFTIIGGVIFWFIYGSRGNYIYYTLYVKKQQLWA